MANAPAADAPNPYLTPSLHAQAPAATEMVGAPPYRQAPAPVRSAGWKPPPKPAPLRVKELAAAGAIVLACDVGLYGGKSGLATGGFGIALVFFAVPLALACAARAWRGSARLGVIVALLAAVVARCIFDPTPATVVAGCALVAAFTLTLRARRMFVPEALMSMGAAVSKLPSRIGAAIAGVRRISARTRIGRVSLLPILVPVALCAVFTGVFALANPVVEHALGVAWAAVASGGGALPSPVRIFVWLAALVAACALLRPACRLAKGSEAANEEGEAAPINLLVARNALAALNVLFLLYNMLDAAYLWSGAPPAGMRTQHYAHHGAFWLTIALVMLTGVVGVTFKGVLAHDARAKASRTLAYVWMGQGVVLALGTYRRMAIHVAHSGLSDLRFVGILGTTLVVVGVFAVALKLRRRKTFTWLLRRQLDAFAVTLALYAVFPTYLVSARVNVARIEGGEYAPVVTVFRLSEKPESAAELLPLLHHEDVRVRQGVAELLEERRLALAIDVADQHSWRQHDVASRRALVALDAAAPEITSALGSADRKAAYQVLRELSRVADEGGSLERIRAVPNAEMWERTPHARSDDD